MNDRTVPLIRCEDVEKRFGHKRVLRDVSFTVSAGKSFLYWAPMDRARRLFCG